MLVNAAHNLSAVQGNVAVDSHVGIGEIPDRRSSQWDLFESAKNVPSPSIAKQRPLPGSARKISDQTARSAVGSMGVDLGAWSTLQETADTLRNALQSVSRRQASDATHVGRNKRLVPFNALSNHVDDRRNALSNNASPSALGAAVHLNRVVTSAAPAVIAADSPENSADRIVFDMTGMIKSIDELGKKLVNILSLSHKALESKKLAESGASLTDTRAMIMRAMPNLIMSKIDNVSRFLSMSIPNLSKASLNAAELTKQIDKLGELKISFTDLKQNIQTIKDAVPTSLTQKKWSAIAGIFGGVSSTVGGGLHYASAASKAVAPPLAIAGGIITLAKTTADAYYDKQHTLPGKDFYPAINACSEAIATIALMQITLQAAKEQMTSKGTTL